MRNNFVVLIYLAYRVKTNTILQAKAHVTTKFIDLVILAAVEHGRPKHLC